MLSLPPQSSEQIGQSIDNINQANINSPYITHEESHVRSGEYLKSAVYGGSDGVINCLAVIIGGIASGTLPGQIIAISMSVVIGDGIGMGLGDYLSAKSEKQFIKSQQQRQLFQVDTMLQDEKSQAIQIYTAKGYTIQQSKRLADLFATNRQAFVNMMMLQQLGLVIDDTNPIINGIVNSVAFMLLGFLPLIPYFVGYYGSRDNQTQYLWTIAIGGTQLFFLGYLKSFLIGFSFFRRVLSGLESLMLGAIALAVGYGIGKIFQNV